MQNIKDLEIQETIIDLNYLENLKNQKTNSTKTNSRKNKKGNQNEKK